MKGHKNTIISIIFAASFLLLSCGMTDEQDISTEVLSSTEITSEIELEIESEIESETESETEIEIESEIELGTETDITQEQSTEMQQESETVSQPQPQPEPAPQPEPQPQTPAINYPPGDYSVGSVYGPYLSQQELNDVAVEVNKFVASYDFSTMDDYTKILTAHDYLCSNVSFAPTWRENQANSAWGALVYKEAQCSGYARAMKALCDAIGVGCYYVHADENAINPSHQWNVVSVDGEWYIIDVQCNDSSGWYAVFLVSDDTYMEIGLSWDRSSVPACPNDYYAGGYYPDYLYPDSEYY